MSVDLEDEFSAAVCSITPERLAALRAAGVPCATPTLAGMAKIETHAGGLFEVAEVDVGLDAAVIVPCGFWDGLNWQLEDLVAFKLGNPGRWWRRLGIADVLGDVRGFTIEPKTLHATPLDWLKAGGRGLCILDWQADPVRLLEGAGDLVADRSLLNRLRKATIKAATERLDTVISYG